MTLLDLLGQIEVEIARHPELAEIPIVEPVGIAGGIRDVNGLSFRLRKSERLDRPQHLVLTLT